MRKIRLNAIAATAIVATIGATQAQAGLLTYDVSEPPVVVDGVIAASYGDVANLVDVSHELVSSEGVVSPMLWWPGGYDDLFGVGWGGTAAGGDRGRVTLASVNSSTVTLNSFDLGVWSSGRGPDETVNIFEIGAMDPVLSYLINEQSDMHWSFIVGLSSMTGFVIEWSSPWWVAIDNLDSSARPADVVSAPEPASAALMMLGLAGLVSMRRRRSARSHETV